MSNPSNFQSGRAVAPPVVLCFSASDPTAGAGAQADLLTLAAMGCHPVTVLTAITVQDTAGVDDVLPLDPEWVVDQARTLLEDMPVAAFKLGLLGSAEIASAIAEILADYPDIPVVLDPVLASGRGDELAGEEALAALHEMLLPQTTVLTPNSVEARRLAEDDSDGEEEDEDAENPAELDLDACAQRLTAAGARYVLITGTHENTAEVVNTLYDSNGVVRADAWERLPGSYHGSGCTLASAIAANLAAGMAVEEAVRDAQDFTWQTLANGFRIGMGQAIPDRLFWARHAPGQEETALEPAA